MRICLRNSFESISVEYWWWPERDICSPWIFIQMWVVSWFPSWSPRLNHIKWMHITSAWLFDNFRIIINKDSANFGWAMLRGKVRQEKLPFVTLRCFYYYGYTLWPLTPPYSICLSLWVQNSSCMRAREALKCVLSCNNYTYTVWTLKDVVQCYS